jgi:hypothetical protein
MALDWLSQCNGLFDAERWSRRASHALGIGGLQLVASSRWAGIGQVWLVGVDMTTMKSPASAVHKDPSINGLTRS